MTLPVNYVVYDLRPFDVPVYVLTTCAASGVTYLNFLRAAAVDFVGLIYLVILAVRRGLSLCRACLTGFYIVHIDSESDPRKWPSDQLDFILVEPSLGFG